MKKNNLYIIIGVLLLIIVVAGSTYAYFSASNQSVDIKGDLANAGIELTVNNLSTSASGYLIPLSSTMLSSAAKGYGNTTITFDASKSCLDKNGYTVCQVYEIVVKNSGSANINLSGGVTTLEGDNTPNIACAVMDSNISVTNTTTCVGSDTIASNIDFASGESKTYYIIVYINNLETPQEDKGEFTGTITFTSTDGKLEADFS